MLLLGAGLNAHSLGMLIQSTLDAATASNPARTTPWPANKPDDNFVRNFARRHNFVLRRTMELSAARANLSTRDLELWQADIEREILANPTYAACMTDPRRNLNMDETAIKKGAGKQTVFALCGTKGVLSKTGPSSKDQFTCALTVNAAGDPVSVRLCYAGERNVASRYLQDLPTNGRTGEWGISISKKGYVNSALFLEILQDIANYIAREKVATPVLLWLDGYSGHVSLPIVDFADQHGIKLVLLRAHMTHILQVSD